MSDQVHDQIRRDWDERAREDAGYYVTFGRCQQSDEEFFATASDVVRALLAEMKRLPPAPRAPAAHPRSAADPGG